MKPFYPAVIEAISEVLQFTDKPSWPDATRLEADLGMDSGLMLELIMQLEETIPGLTIDQATLSYEHFETIASVCDFVSLSLRKDQVA